MQRKWYLKSKTTWGIIVGALPVLAQLIGLGLGSDDIELISDTGDAILTAAGMLFAAYGRFVAKEPLSFTRKQETSQ